MSAVSVPTTARDELSEMTVLVSADLRRRVSMGAVMAAALTVAQEHSDRLREILTAQLEEGTDAP